MAKVRVKHGIHGPSHDPYGYTEVTFTRTDGHVIRMRVGLGVYLLIDGKQCGFRLDRTYYDVFKAFTGMSFNDAEHIPEVLEECRLRRMTWQERCNYWMCMEADEAMLRNCY